MSNVDTLVLNWHLTEACNYRCRYCYATWEEPPYLRGIMHDHQQTSALLGELYQFFRPGNSANPLAERMSWGRVRLSLAGGEPLLYAGRLSSIVRTARDLGFEVSIITNGSLLTRELLHQLGPNLTWLGISLDSANQRTNRSIGRSDCRGQLLQYDELAACLQLFRQHNPSLRLKINTVVNRLNHDQDLTPLIESFSPDKWKVLRMLPIVNQYLAVNDGQFAAFVARHKGFPGVLRVEDNQDMRDSYLMVDPYGRFFQNSSPVAGQGYVYSQPILGVGVREAFSELTFAHERFRSRYVQLVAGVRA